MNKLILFLTFLAFTINAVAQPSLPKVFFTDVKTLQANKQRIAAKDPQLMLAYNNLINDAEAALKQGPFSVMEKKNTPPSGDMHDYMSLAPYHWPDSSKPNGLPYLRRDGQTNPEVQEYTDKWHFQRMISLVEVLGPAYYFSGDERYAKHAALLLRTWFLDPATLMNPNLKYAQAIKGVNEGRGAGIIDSRHLLRLFDPIGMLQSSAHWSKKDTRGMQQWFTDYRHWLQTHPNGLHEMKAQNNHGTWYDLQRLAFAVFADSLDAAKEIVASAKNRLDEQMDADGLFPKENARTLALHYNAFNLEAYMMIAIFAYHAGIDFWSYTSPNGHSIRKGFDALKPYITNQKEWTGAQIKPFDYVEDAYPILTYATRGLKCGDCMKAIHQLAGKEAATLRSNLFN